MQYSANESPVILTASISSACFCIDSLKFQ